MTPITSLNKDLVVATFFFQISGTKKSYRWLYMSKGFPRKLRNRELTGKPLQYAPDLFTNPKLHHVWDFIIPRDLKEWNTEGELIYALWGDWFWHRLMINKPKCKETLLECATLAELLTAPQDLYKVHIRDLESWCSLSYKSLYRLGCSILKTLWVHTNKYTLCTLLDNLCLEHTFAWQSV